MRFGITWLFVATAIVAFILGVSQLQGEFIGFLVNCFLAPTFIAAFARVELRWTILACIFTVIFCSMLSGSLFACSWTAYAIFEEAPRLKSAEVMLLGAFFRAGTLGGLVSPVPIGLFLISIPFLDTHIETKNNNGKIVSPDSRLP
ncbi:MAG: hypothetical protein AB8B55_11960 [Mariniblastus sp.]